MHPCVSFNLLIRHVIGTALVAATLSSACPGLARSDWRIEISRQDPHVVAMFLARALGANVVVLGEAPRVSLSLTTRDRLVAFSELARQANWEMVRVGPILVLAPREIASLVRGFRLPSGARAIDLNLLRARSSALTELLDTVIRREGVPVERVEVSVCVRNVRAVGLRALLTRLMPRHATTQTVADRPTVPAADCPGETFGYVALRCERLADLLCAGTVSRDDHAVEALMVHQSNARLFATLRRGDRIGAESARATNVDQSAVTLQPDAPTPCCLPTLTLACLSARAQ